MLRILHFADAHIDMINHGRHDPISGLPLRVLDFLKSLDVIVDTAIRERVDLVIFAGDAYKDRTPAPTFQREWGKRIMRLSRAGIPTFLLVGNHDLSPSLGRANSIQEFDTLGVPHVRVLAKPEFLSPVDLEDLPLQLLALPWISRSALMANLELSSTDINLVNQEIEARLTRIVQDWLDQADPSLPVVLTAHASVQGAVMGGERSVMLGSDMLLPGSLVKDPRLSYVALGHIHKPQDLNEGRQPPVIYPGSIERVDFGEAQDERYFVIAHVQAGKDTQVEWRRLEGVRPFIDRTIRIESAENVPAQLLAALPAPEQMQDAIVRLVVAYPREWEGLLDENGLREQAAGAFEFHLVKRPVIEARGRLNSDQPINSYSSLELLDVYWRASNTRPEDIQALQALAEDILRGFPPPTL
ncbi:MAG: exonuclease SbcCD subunit D [Anaerolineaceae bacterium]|nr:exonuclease SbcCD subunit D [Anaerolineaceae bacterium]